MNIGLDISILNDKQKTGIAVYTFNLIDALLKINKKDKFLLFGFATFETSNYLKNLHFKNYPNVEMKIHKMPARFFRTFFLIWQKINRPFIENFTGSLDIIHSFNWYFPPAKSAKKIATVFDMTPLLFPSFHQEKTIQLDRVRLERVKREADLVITISKNSKFDFLKFSKNSKVEVIYPAVSEIFLKKLDKKKSQQVLTKYHLKNNYFLSVGTIEPRKNINGLIRAYLKSNLDEKLVLVGNWGWERDDLFKLIQKNQNKIISTGFVEEEDLPYLYGNALAFIYPSFYEGFGLPILEAQTCGCPVITSNNSSLPEAAGKGAIYINPNSTQDIIKAIKKISKIRAELIKKGYENVKRFSWQKSAYQLNLLYQSM